MNIKPGVSCLIACLLTIGAADLSASLGVPWQTQHPQVKGALNRIANAVESTQAQFCAIPRAIEDYQAWLAQGVSMFVLGIDRGVMRQALQTNKQKFVNGY